jgi:Glycosyl transferases group 1
MARIAYVDHSYHRSTLSTGFLVEILQRHGHVVDRFWDEAWRGGAPVPWPEVQGYDVVIMFQSYCTPPARHFRHVHPNVIYIPMLDQFALWQGPVTPLSEFWEPFQGSKVLNFSTALHGLTKSFGIASHFVRYYQPTRPAVAPSEGLHGFFWVRRQSQLPWDSIRRLIGTVRFDSMHLHLAGDPGSPPSEMPPAEDIARHSITTSTWFEDKKDLEAVLDRANVFFASRLDEGIGQAFLEAMGRGQCVVAPNQGTMNEYILPGFNGLLYELDALQPLDFSQVHALGARGWESARAGRVQWEQAEEALLRFILAPSESLYAGKYQHPSVHVQGAVGAGAVKMDVMSRKVATRLRGVASYAFFRKTRVLWHPLLQWMRRLVSR